MEEASHVVLAMFAEPIARDEGRVERARISKPASQYVPVWEFEISMCT